MTNLLNYVSQPHASSYYAATANDRTLHVPLTGRTHADVCVIGGGFTGLCTALELAQKGYSVVLVEASKIGWGASGRNGGQLITGFSCDLDTFARYMPDEEVKQVFAMGLESVDIVKGHIARHSIDCDLTMGYVIAANKSRHLDGLRAWRDEAATRFDYHGYRFLEATEMTRHVESQRYPGGLYCTDSGHLHPLNYALGLAKAANSEGVRIYEDTAALSLRKNGTLHEIVCDKGRVEAKYVVLACNAYQAGLAPQLARKIIPVATHIIATEPLARRVMPSNVAIADSSHRLDYFRMSADGRMLWGGGATGSKRTHPHVSGWLKWNMLKTFPQLKHVKIDYCWGGLIDATMNRAPHFGRLEPDVYFAQGFSGHGVNATALAGKLIAESINAQSTRFDVFEKVKHRDIPWGPALHRPMLALAMAWGTLRDIL
ncbi:gamma-glutamylputrescine oxidase [Paraburkholderia bryophila]|uniref:Gamma-glutamylputrescine oxidase n=1 Tax=Paraburkholderia bryophila TaxID=420952 RepID=A0A7Y9W4I5_9BURK|nr:gamma-glutamylputrescine oxidase [Paraburkholderia bryophila]